MNTSYIKNPKNFIIEQKLSNNQYTFFNTNKEIFTLKKKDNNWIFKKYKIKLSNLSSNTPKIIDKSLIFVKKLKNPKSIFPNFNKLKILENETIIIGGIPFKYKKNIFNHKIDTKLINISILETEKELNNLIKYNESTTQISIINIELKNLYNTLTKKNV